MFKNNFLRVAILYSVVLVGASAQTYPTDTIVTMQNAEELAQP